MHIDNMHFRFARPCFADKEFPCQSAANVLKDVTLSSFFFKMLKKKLSQGGDGNRHGLLACGAWVQKICDVHPQTPKPWFGSTYEGFQMFEDDW